MAFERIDVERVVPAVHRADANDVRDLAEGLELLEPRVVETDGVDERQRVTLANDRHVATELPGRSEELPFHRARDEEDVGKDFGELSVRQGFCVTHSLSSRTSVPEATHRARTFAA